MSGMRFDTRLVHAGHEPSGAGDLIPPVHLSSTYEHRVQETPRYFYARGENPTREALERCLASLEDARYAAVFATGQAAAATAVSLLPSGHRLVCVDDLYAGTDSLFTALDIPVQYADLCDPEERDAALAGPDLGLVWLETPTNPLLKMVDIEAVRRCVAGRGVPVVVDNTLASPVLQQPLASGADISLYSTTKFISGHGDVLGGALVYDDEGIDTRVRTHRNAVGSVPGALDCFLVHRGLRTLSVRVARQAQNAQAVLEVLRSSPAVDQIYYPGLPDHPQHTLGKRQMAGPGSIISFECPAGGAGRLLDRVRLFSCAASLGGVRSLIGRPALMTHRSLPPDVRAGRGITESLVRLSVGIEDPRDLADDLRAALGP